MYQRFVFLKLKDGMDSAKDVDDVIAESLRVLPTIPGVLGCQAGRPASEGAAKGWDLCLTLQFESVEAIETYRVHPIHQTFLTEFFAPRAEAKRVWNFQMECAVAPK